MADTNVLIPSSNVQGNITSCKIENQKIKTERKSVWSLTESNTYASYDACTRQVLSEYQIPGFTGAFGLYVALGLAAIFVAVCALITVALRSDSI